jgi:eukaryotic-like serine/threonine-protein kinase
MSTPPVPERHYPLPGEVLEGKYEIQRILGEGAMGAVVRATHVLRKAPVALKFMSPEIMEVAGVVDRFLNEGVAASQIDSEHVVKVLDVSRLETGIPYIVMEYLEGEDLRELLTREGRPGLSDIPRCVHFVLQILRGLQVAHRAGIVHRDMKPANCFIVQKDGEPDFLKLVDFGISKVQQPDAIQLTNAGASLGTPLYMSPEQARSPRDVDSRSDLYAAAVILYELLSGNPPFVPESGTLSELLIRLGTEEPESIETTRTDLPAGLWTAIYRGLAKNPKERYQSAAEMAEALEPFADDRSSSVLRKILARAQSGLSQYPPAQGPPTHVDPKIPFHPPESTVMIPSQPPSQLGSPSGAVSAKTQERGGTLAIMGDTAQGTAQDASQSADRRRSPRVWFAAALAWGAVAAGVIWYFQDSPSSDDHATSDPGDPSSASDRDGVESKPPPSVDPVEQAPSVIAPIPASAMADASASAPPTSPPAPLVGSVSPPLNPPVSPITPPPASTKPTLGSITIDD